MPVNGIELKEGQVWQDQSGNKRTMQRNHDDKYPWKGLLDNGEYCTYTNHGTYYQNTTSYFDLVVLISEKEKPMKFTPQPGDKIICNNGEEFICCTLDFLHAKDRFPSKTEALLGFNYNEETWQDWYSDGTCGSYDYNIQEVIPQSSEVTADKKEESRYTLQEIKEAWDTSGWVTSTSSWSTFQKNLTKINSPEYKEYLRLRAIYE